MTKVSPPLVMTRERFGSENASVTVPTTLGMQRLGGSNQVLGCRVQVGGDFVVGSPVPTRKRPHLSGSVKNCQSPQCQTTSARP